MSEWQKKRVLMLVKTYPSPSTKYQEVVCTAGITDTGELIRLYPIKFRYLNESQKFKKFQWIELFVKKNPQDNRPESYRVNYDSIKALNVLDAQKDADKRRILVSSLVSSSVEELQENYQKTGVSLGIIKPTEITEIIIEETAKDWTDKEKNVLNQMSFGEEEVVPLEKIPYDFSFKYRCAESSCAGHKMKITDWEICETYRKFKRLYGEEEGIRKLKEKWLSMFQNPNTDFYFVLGTVHRWETFIIIGYINLKKNTQISLL